jgi:hypothetical protein
MLGFFPLCLGAHAEVPFHYTDRGLDGIQSSSSVRQVGNVKEMEGKLRRVMIVMAALPPFGLEEDDPFRGSD